MITKLDIGAGNFHAQGEEWTTIDIVGTFRPDVLGDAHRLPYQDGSLRGIKCFHVLEHIPRDYFVFHWYPKEDEIPGPASYLYGYTIKAGSRSYIEARHGLVDVMNECWRVLQPGGEIWIEVPLFPTEEAIADPTHGSFLVSSTFDYFKLCEDHTGDEAHTYTCRDDHRRMYGIKPWRIKQRERLNHARVLGVIMEKVTE